MGSVKFIIDSDLIELVDAIGLDYEESESQDDEIVIILDNVDELVGGMVFDLDNDFFDLKDLNQKQELSFNFILYLHYYSNWTNNINNI